MDGSVDHDRAQREALTTLKDNATNAASPAAVAARHRALLRYLAAAFYGVRRSPKKP